MERTMPCCAAPNTPLLPRLVLASLVASLALSTAASAATFIVNSTADFADNNAGDGTCSTGNVIVVSTVPLVFAIECTFRAALLEANANPGSDTIEFSGILPTTAGVVEIIPSSGYPAIDDTLIIDGYSHPSYDVPDPNATPIINLVGTSVSLTTPALRVYPGASSSIVRGLAISGFPGTGIQIAGLSPSPSTTNVIVEGNHIGIWRGVFYTGNGNNGISINTSDDNTIGLRCGSLTGCLGKRNVISSNTNDGISVTNSVSNVIAGNYIGTDRLGLSTFVPFGGSTRNGGHGIELDATSSGNFIGSVGSTFNGGSFDFVSGGNLISGNDLTGIRIDGGGNSVYSNKIGTNAAGTGALANSGSGIIVAADNTTIGGFFELEGNLISGNGSSGITVESEFGSDPLLLEIRYNTIGLNATRDAALGNAQNGLVLWGGGHIIENNYIGGNGNHGISDTSSGSIIRSNVIGTNDAGDDLGNANVGIRISEGNQLIGGSGAGNTIGFNAVGIDGGGSSYSNEIVGNFIGTNANGDDLGNDGIGLIVGGPNYDVGAVNGRANGLGNTIGFNGEEGIRDTGFDTRIQGNFVGTNAFGDDLGNALAGIRSDGISGPASAIGANLGTPAADVPLAGNIVGNNGAGIVIDATAVEIPIRGNQLFSNSGPGIDLGGDGETANDEDDFDGGANRLQNYPVFDPAQTFYNPGTGDITVRFAVDGVVPNTSFPLTVDLYLYDPWLNPGDEAASHLGAVTYDPLVPGDFVSVTFTPQAGSLSPNAFGDIFGGLRGTATDSIANTSELSVQNVPVPEPGPFVGLAAGLIGLGALAGRRLEPKTR
jgi:hypothetical protein